MIVTILNSSEKLNYKHKEHVDLSKSVNGMLFCFWGLEGQRDKYPSYVADEEENEQLNLWKTPLIDNVNTWTLQL